MTTNPFDIKSEYHTVIEFIDGAWRLVATYGSGYSGQQQAKHHVSRIFNNTGTPAAVRNDASRVVFRMGVAR